VINEILKFPIRNEADFRQAFHSLLEAGCDPRKREAVYEFVSQIRGNRVKAALTTSIRWYAAMDEHLKHKADR
jgi:hypothetical protein